MFKGNVVKKVEDVMPIATGHEREELEAELQVSFYCFIHYEGFFGVIDTILIVFLNVFC